MGESYPELVRARSLIEQVLKQEEEKFHQTLDKGLKLLQESTASLNKEGSLSGDIAFKLYDTYGFPLDLTQDILRSDNKTVDEKGFQDCMEVQNKRREKRQRFRRLPTKISGSKSMTNLARQSF